MRYFLELTRQVSLEGKALEDLFLTVIDIFKNKSPQIAQRNLRWDLAKFLVLYPMPSKKLNVYKKLNDIQQLSFCIRYLIGVAYKEKIPKPLINLHRELQEDVVVYRKWTNDEQAKYKKFAASSNYNHADAAKILFKATEYESKLKVCTRLLTQLTKEIIDNLFNKRLFLLNANPYFFIEHLKKEK